jgi:hypothetical protein
VGDVGFFARVPFLLEQDITPFLTAQRLFAIMHDRLIIPLAWWRYDAAAMYLEECLSKIDRHALAPSGEALRQWACRLKLKAEQPAIITEWIPGVGPPPGGFDEEAYLKSPIPKPAVKHRYTPKLSIDAVALEGKRPIL